jgi:hypothetical protein
MRQHLTTVSRRSLIHFFVASTSLTLLPVRAKSEPMTVLAASAAVVSIISGVATFLSDSRKEALLREINGKLDAVIRNQEIILSEIRALKLYIDESLYRSFRENTIVRMNAHQDRFEVLITERPNNSNKSEYIDLETSVSQTAFELGQYDTPAYIAFGAGVGMTLALHQVVGLGKDRFKKLKEVFKRPYDRWLDANNTKSIIAIVAATKTEVDQRTKNLNARPRTVKFENTQGRCTYTTVITISGDLTNGFSGVSTTSKTCFDPPDICDRNPRMCPTVLGDEFQSTEMQVTNRLLGYLSILTTSDAKEVTVPQYIPSGVAPVDEMNKERIAIFELMNLMARQQMIQEHMEKCRSALAA